jgi:DNA polymerase-3 subunit epsilon
LESEHSNFAIVDDGRKEDEKSIIKVGGGKLQGIGYFDTNVVQSLEEAIELIEPLQTNEYVMNIVHKYANEHLDKVAFIEP